MFISYAPTDLARAAALRHRLVAAGLSVWFDKVRLTPGCDWHKEIEAGCESAHLVLPLITPRWEASEWTRYETYAHVSVIPVLAEGTAGSLPPPLRRWNAVVLDPLTAKEATWRVLLNAINAKLSEPLPERGPRIVDLPHPANPYFTGRDDELVRIHEELHTAPVAALTPQPSEARVRALAAMGGIGKTTLANEYARRYWRLYPQILWVDARIGLESGFASKFALLFPNHSDADMQQSEKAQMVLAELSGPAERLLVLDDVKDIESVRSWLPRGATSGCRTLITSRFADWPEPEGVRAIHLDVWEPEPARVFLLTRTKRTAEGAERAACDDLANELGYLPLALEQAAAYIAAPGAGVDFVGYLRLYRTVARELLQRRVLGSTNYPDSMMTTWQVTAAQLSPESRAVLRLCAWYAATPIPRVLVIDGAEEVLTLAAGFGPVVPLRSREAAELRMRDALVGLARYSMILDATDTTFWVHGLVRTVERVQAEVDGTASDGRDLALTRLGHMFPHADSEPTRWPLCRQLLPHQQALLTYAFPDAATSRIVRLLSLAGDFLRSSGDAFGALPLYRRALEISERVQGPHHVDTLRSVGNLAMCMDALGNALGALPLHQRALQSRERVPGLEHFDTLTSVNNLAYCMQALGNALGALPLHQRALKYRERVLGPDHPDTLTSVNNLAGCMYDLDDASGALPLFRRALKWRERFLGPENPQTLTSMNNLARCMEALNDASGALPLYRRALESSERALGPHHPTTRGIRANCERADRAVTLRTARS